MLEKNVIEFGEIHKFPKLSAEDINRSVGIPKVVQSVDDNGRLTSKLVFEVTPVEKLNEGLKVDDFALEVLLANGYDLHRVDFHSNSFGDIDRVDEVAKTLSQDQDVKNSVKQNVKVED